MPHASGAGCRGNNHPRWPNSAKTATGDRIGWPGVYAGLYRDAAVRDYDIGATLGGKASQAASGDGGYAACAPDGQGSAIVNLSFGISILDGVRDYALTNADFAATDLAIEMLYLVEAKSAAMEASRKLNLRLQGAKNAAEEQAYTDTLTGLKNRRALDHLLEQLLAADAAFAVMHIDLDYFKAVNDTLGHAAGDHVLQVVAQAMLEETRTTDTVARVGGDEFTVILPQVSDIDVLERVGGRIIEWIEVPIPFNDALCKISASIGTVWIQSSKSVTRETVMEDADIALYASKNEGRARQTMYTPELRESANATTPPKGRDDCSS